MAEGKTEKALAIALVLRDCPVESNTVQAEGDCLLADLQAVLPAGQFEAVLQQAESKRSAGQARAYTLADELVREGE